MTSEAESRATEYFSSTSLAMASCAIRLQRPCVSTPPDERLSMSPFIVRRAGDGGLDLHRCVPGEFNLSTSAKRSGPTPAARPASPPPIMPATSPASTPTATPRKPATLTPSPNPSRLDESAQASMKGSMAAVQMFMAQGTPTPECLKTGKCALVREIVLSERALEGGGFPPIMVKDVGGEKRVKEVVAGMRRGDESVQVFFVGNRVAT